MQIKTAVATVAMTTASLCGCLTLAAAQKKQNVPEHKAWGENYTRQPRERGNGRKKSPAHGHYGGAMGRLKHWNEVAIDASGLDHTPADPGEHGSGGECRTRGGAVRGGVVQGTAEVDGHGQPSDARST